MVSGCWYVWAAMCMWIENNSFKVLKPIRAVKSADIKKVPNRQTIWNFFYKLN